MGLRWHWGTAARLCREQWHPDCEQWRPLRKRAGDDPRQQLLRMFESLEEILIDDSFNGCIFINVAVEFPLAHDPAHIAAAGADDPDALAGELSLLLEGAYVTRQVTGDTGAVVETAGRLARMAVDRRVPAQKSV